jgi:hypothetical protein
MCTLHAESVPSTGHARECDRNDLDELSDSRADNSIFETRPEHLLSWCDYLHKKSVTQSKILPREGVGTSPWRSSTGGVPDLILQLKSSKRRISTRGALGYQWLF